MEESAFIDRARAFVESHPDCFHCDLWPAHVTGSAWVVNPERSRVLLMHHRKHDQWFQPGGHADGHADIVAVALRETAEESGIDPDHIHLVDGRVFDLDIHRIPASHRGPEHDHIDVRFLVEIDDRSRAMTNPTMSGGCPSIRCRDSTITARPSAWLKKRGGCDRGRITPEYR
jgi:ADP-ribose pyrophosphatase YjhB (NUDIX family)